jgi:tungstate transport system substrate-binding protein
MASEKQAYTLSDRGTFLVLKGKLELKLLEQGDKMLRNPYSVIAVNPARHPDVNYMGAMSLIAWLTSPKAQQMIGSFGRERFPSALFHPLAVPQAAER